MTIRGARAANNRTGSRWKGGSVCVWELVRIQCISHLVNLSVFSGAVGFASPISSAIASGGAAPICVIPKLAVRTQSYIVHPFSTRGMFGWLRGGPSRTTVHMVLRLWLHAGSPRSTHIGERQHVGCQQCASRCAARRRGPRVKAILELSILALSSYREYQRSNISLSWLPISPLARCSFVFA